MYGAQPCVCHDLLRASSHPSTVTRCAQLLYSVTAPEGDASHESLPCVLVRKMLLNEVVDANDERLVAQVCSHTTQASSLDLHDVTHPSLSLPLRCFWCSGHG